MAAKIELKARIYRDAKMAEVIGGAQIPLFHVTCRARNSVQR